MPTAVQRVPVEREPLPPAQLEDLEEAWAELARAAEGAGVTTFHACTRTGKSWEEDPAAVRAVAATLRAQRADGAAPEGQPSADR